MCSHTLASEIKADYEGTLILLQNIKYKNRRVLVIRLVFNHVNGNKRARHELKYEIEIAY